MAEKADVLFVGPKKAVIVDGLSPAFNLHFLADAKDRDAFVAAVAPRIRAIASSVSSERIDAALMSRLPAWRSSRPSRSATTTSTPSRQPDPA